MTRWWDIAVVFGNQAGDVIDGPDSSITLAIVKTLDIDWIETSDQVVKTVRLRFGAAPAPLDSNEAAA